jgi:hypothetical protein
MVFYVAPQFKFWISKEFHVDSYFYAPLVITLQPINVFRVSFLAYSSFCSELCDKCL